MQCWTSYPCWLKATFANNSLSWSHYFSATFSYSISSCSLGLILVYFKTLFMLSGLPSCPPVRRELSSNGCQLGESVWLSLFSFHDGSSSSAGEWRRGPASRDPPPSLSSHYTQPTVCTHCPGLPAERRRDGSSVLRSTHQQGSSWTDYLCSSRRTQEGGISTLKLQSCLSAAISANYRSNCMDLRVNPRACEPYRSISHTAWEWELLGQDRGGPCLGLSARPFSACSPAVLCGCISTKHDSQQVSKNAMPALPSCNFLELPNLGKRKQPLVSRRMGLHLCISIAGITEFFCFHSCTQALRLTKVSSFFLFFIL